MASSVNPRSGDRRRADGSAGDAEGLDSASETALRDLLSAAAPWLLDALSRGLEQPDWERSAHFLQSMTSAERRLELARMLIDEATPEDADPALWSAWATHGVAPRMRWMELPESVGRKRQHARDYDRELAQVAAMDAVETDLRRRADALEKEAVGLRAEADVQANKSRQARYRARAYLKMLMEVAHTRAMSPVFAMGPAWVLMKLCANADNPRRLMQNLYALSDNHAFMDKASTAIESAAEDAVGVLENRGDPIRRCGTLDMQTMLPGRPTRAEIAEVIAPLLSSAARVRVNAEVASGCATAERPGEFDASSSRSLDTHANTMFDTEEFDGAVREPLDNPTIEDLFLPEDAPPYDDTLTPPLLTAEQAAEEVGRIQDLVLSDCERDYS